MAIPYLVSRGRVLTDSAGSEIDPIRGYMTNVAFGLEPGHVRIARHGRNPDVDGPEDVWDGGGDYPWMTAATSLEVVSTSANDTSAGTGARTVRIEGLDATYTELNQTVTLNGLTAVAVPSQMFRINRVILASAGSSKVNAGDIIVRDAGVGTTRGIILTGRGMGAQSQYTVPAGKTLIVHEMTFCINRPSTSRDATVSSYVAFPATSNIAVFGDDYTVNGNPWTHVEYPAFALPEKTDFGFRCLNVSATNTDITASWCGILKDNGII